MHIICPNFTQYAFGSTKYRYGKKECVHGYILVYVNTMQRNGGNKSKLNQWKGLRRSDRQMKANDLRVMISRGVTLNPVLSPARIGKVESGFIWTNDTRVAWSVKA